MEKHVLAAKIKELRISKGYSQEYLAEAAQLSLRTVQRIENAETEPRGDTLNRLAKVLEVKIAELTELRSVTHDNKNYLAGMNLSAIIFIILQIPFLSFVIPLMFWLIKKDQFEDVYERGKQILNFQITWGIIVFFLLFTVIFAKITHSRITIPLGFLPPNFRGISAVTLLKTALVVTICNLLMIIINTILIMNNRSMKYWPAYRFFK